MRKTIITLVIIALVWIGYIAWPLYELAVMVRAIDDRDLATVARHVRPQGQPEAALRTADQ